jgi:hypothetical protein
MSALTEWIEYELVKRNHSEFCGLREPTLKQLVVLRDMVIAEMLPIAYARVKRVWCFDCQNRVEKACSNTCDLEDI